MPIVEPEVLMDGGHSIERSFEVTSRVQHAVFIELRDQRVEPEGMLLKPNMVLPGYDSGNEASPDEVAEWTLKCLRRHVPCGRARDRVPLRRPERRGRDREPERDERRRAAPVAALLLVRARARRPLR